MRALGNISIVILFLISGCGKFSSTPTVTNLSELSEKDRVGILETIRSLNESLGKTVVSVSEQYPGSGVPVGTGYPIRVETEGELQSFELGHSWTNFNGCRMRLRTRLLREDSKDLRKAVFAHELAHCNGFPHDDDPKSIMHALTKAWSTYSDEAIANFARLFEDGIKIH